jgi:hypothetical protein
MDIVGSHEKTVRNGIPAKTIFTGNLFCNSYFQGNQENYNF